MRPSARARRRAGVLLAGLLLVSAVAGSGVRAENGDVEPEDPPTSELGVVGPYCMLDSHPAVPGLADAGQIVTLKTLVFADRIETDRARAVMARVTDTYRDIGIALDVTYRKLDLRGREAGDLLVQMRRNLATTHTQGFDLVHALTAAELTDRTAPVAGMARCIGGIRYSKYHLAVSISRADMPEEARYSNVPIVGPITVWTTRPALTATHELAHLLGALHEHANCVENAPHSAPPNQIAVCTIMDVNLQYRQLRFGTLEKAVVRSFALRYG